jgi:hypothetical protein
MNAYEILASLILGIILGVLGQGIRVIVGLKKMSEESNSTNKNFDIKRLILSLGIGGVAGGLGAIILLDQKLDKELLLTFVATGYAGTDFIEGVLKTQLQKLPELTTKVQIVSDEGSPIEPS